MMASVLRHPKKLTTESQRRGEDGENSPGQPSFFLGVGAFQWRFLALFSEDGQRGREAQAH